MWISGRVDYAGWAQHIPHPEATAGCTDKPETMDAEEHLAHWINLYTLHHPGRASNAYPDRLDPPTLAGPARTGSAFWRFFGNASDPGLRSNDQSGLD